MPLISLPAHFDGNRICLDEKFNLEPNTKLIVTIVSQSDDEHDDWLKLSSQMLKHAYGDDEPEYPASLIKEGNPNYEAR
ncbi:MAG: hypothetical protein ACUZ8O_11345 [Candidatus Anammoxibacter sp.]